MIIKEKNLLIVVTILLQSVFNVYVHFDVDYKEVHVLKVEK